MAAQWEGLFDGFAFRTQLLSPANSDPEGFIDLFTGCGVPDTDAIKFLNWPASISGSLNETLFADTVPLSNVTTSELFSCDAGSNENATAQQITLSPNSESGSLSDELRAERKSRRQQQNRAAQRAFRERRQQQIHVLTDRIKELERANRQLTLDYEGAKRKVEELREQTDSMQRMVMKYWCS